MDSVVQVSSLFLSLIQLSHYLSPWDPHCTSITSSHYFHDTCLCVAVSKTRTRGSWPCNSPVINYPQPTPTTSSESVLPPPPLPPSTSSSSLQLPVSSPPFLPFLSLGSSPRLPPALFFSVPPLRRHTNLRRARVTFEPRMSSGSLHVGSGSERKNTAERIYVFTPSV